MQPDPCRSPGDAGAVPVIDLAAARAGNRAARRGVTDAIARACADVGFFELTGHGVPHPLVARAFDVSRQLFALPPDQKATLDIHRSPYMRGYFGHGADLSDGVHGDLKEGFDLAADTPPDDPYVRAGLPFYGPNVWPDQLPAFRPTMTDYHARLLALGRDLLGHFAAGLGVRDDFFDDKFVKPMAQIRMLRYPPQPPAGAASIGAGAHTDFGWITMIAQDGSSGLEIQTRRGDWVPVAFAPGSFVVNVGDLMSRWTNDRYPATMHRVVNRGLRDRYSIAFFMDPDYHATVECLESCRSPQRPTKYPPIVVGDYMNRRFHETTTFRREAA